MSAMDAAVGGTALVLVFVGVVLARAGRARAREGDRAVLLGYVGLVVMAVGLFFAMNVSLWLILAAMAVAEAARRLSVRAGR
ncbi:hypothetical protein EV189_1817 [Motilibacter rhizosphaerae]|uniref:Uncharacterized protein n=1 Tax=Motilibacter rhizosphaerae TaxID=598652 RepID=A0A4Q7NSM6_9ACTN|nr:hypothetical protein [Motilibacter rhizosphaerae]RZS90035.1 hypothetical protein EV189_1817 [Motilibacter rhizosphaerae]